MDNIEFQNMLFPDKYVEPGMAKSVVKEWKKRSLSVALALGCFDLLHVGCVRFLREAGARADMLLVGVFDDASVGVIKGEGRPVLMLRHRLDMVAALEPVAAVMPVSLENLKTGMLELNPDYLIVGRDFPDAPNHAPPFFENEGRIVVSGGTSMSCSDRLINEIRARGGI